MLGIAANFAINQSHRVFGPAVSMQKEIAGNITEEGFDLTFACPNKASVGVFERAGYKVLGNVENWAKILRVENKLLNYLKNPLIAKFFGSFINLIILLYDLRFEFFKRKKFEIKIARTFNESFDNLWKEARKNYKIVGEKSITFLNWRYASSNIEQYEFFCIFEKNSQLLKGYLVFSQKNGIVIIWDLLVSKNEDIFFLLYEFLKQMRRKRVDSISITFLTNNLFRKIVQKLGFVKRPIGRKCLVFFSDKLSLEEQKFILDINNWFFLDGEIDL